MLTTVCSQPHANADTDRLSINLCVPRATSPLPVRRRQVSLLCTRLEGQGGGRDALRAADKPGVSYHDCCDCKASAVCQQVSAEQYSAPHGRTAGQSAYATPKTSANSVAAVSQHRRPSSPQARAWHMPCTIQKRAPLTLCAAHFQPLQPQCRSATRSQALARLMSQRQPNASMPTRTAGLIAGGNANAVPLTSKCQASKCSSSTTSTARLASRQHMQQQAVCLFQRLSYCSRATPC